MSSLLEQAIIDAKLLRDTARKNAEAAILEQYESEIKQNIESLLEQDEPSADPLSDLGGGDDLGGGLDTTPMDLGGTGGAPVANLKPEVKKVTDKIPPSFLGENNLQEIELNLDTIIEKIDSLEKDLKIKSPDFSSSAADVQAHSNIPEMPMDGLSESVEEESVEEESVEEEGCQEEGCQEEEDHIHEEITLDMDIVTPGGINANEIELKKQYAIAGALEAQKDDLVEQLNLKDEELNVMEQKLHDMLSKLQDTRGKLKKSIELNTQLKEGFEFLTKKINEVNVLNARLLYTNKVLGNNSFNERQKKQIAESVSAAKSVEEAKTIYETLLKSTESAADRKVAPKSLTEAINKAPSAFLPRVQQSIDPVSERWKIIAGIKK